MAAGSLCWGAASSPRPPRGASPQPATPPPALPLQPADPGRHAVLHPPSPAVPPPAPGLSRSSSGTAGSTPSWGGPSLTPRSLHVCRTLPPRVSHARACHCHSCVPGLLTCVSSSPGRSQEDSDRCLTPCPHPTPAQCQGRFDGRLGWTSALVTAVIASRFLLRVNPAKRESLAFPAKGVPQ